MSKPDFVHAIYIRAEPQAVWNALTSPDATERFWWGERCQADWSVGAAVRFHDAERDIGFTGEVLEADPPRRLVFTFKVEGVHEEHPDGPSIVTYEIDGGRGLTKLVVTHGRFAEGGRLRDDVAGGWPAILSSLKSFLETGEPLPREALES